MGTSSLFRVNAMHARISEGTVYFSNILNEDTDFENLVTLLETSRQRAIRISFAGVERANSCGIIAWFRLVRDLELRVRYVESPVWLIEQLNMSPFFLRKSVVESFYAPFFDPESRKQRLCLLTIGVDVPILAGYENFVWHPQDPSLALLEPDFEPEEYFRFIAANLSEFRTGAA